MKSMTGYGKAELTVGPKKVTVEIYSVNRRQMEIQVILPNDFYVYEVHIRELIAEHVVRGQVTVRITAVLIPGAKVKPVEINRELAKEYARQFRKLAKEIGCEDEVDLELILEAPGVMTSFQPAVEDEKTWKQLKLGIDRALKDFLSMRTKEGKHLEEDLKNRIKNMQSELEKVKKRAPEVVKRYRQQLEERIKAAGLSVAPEDEERILKEIVLFADRSDISEEIARLESHFKKFYEYLKQKEPIGKTFDFLAQEMNREINTIGSKSNDQYIAHSVVTLKTELEKFREQVQNIE
ncbi:MAG: YicC family protein [Verrucomicrobiae bacterium]|nr:YicC family protein [Verrucomicrobiae bacterium]